MIKVDKDECDFCGACIAVCPVDCIDLFEKDILNYERQIDSWIKNSADAVLYVRYEELWDKLEEIKEFLGFEVFLPDRRERSHKPVPKKINTELFKYLESLMSK